MFGADVGGREAVDPDAVGREVDGHALGDMGHGRLRRPVGHHAGARVHGCDGSVVDDRATAVVLHVPRRALGADDHPEEVHVHDPREVLEVVRQEPLERAPDPGVVEHDVEAAEAVDGEVDQCLHLIRIAHIGLPEGGRITDGRGDLVTSVDVDIRNHDSRSLGHEQFGALPGRYPRHRRSRSPPSRPAPATSCRDHTGSQPLEPAMALLDRTLTCALAAECSTMYQPPTVA